MPYSEEIPATHNQSLQLTLILMEHGSHPVIHPDEQWAQRSDNDTAPITTATELTPPANRKSFM